jgi:DNA-directed RNA polymerase subunit E'/Rpb7
MFVLVEMVDTVRIPPWQFERKLNDSIAEELNKKLANKVLGSRAGRACVAREGPALQGPTPRRPGLGQVA